MPSNMGDVGYENALPDVVDFFNEEWDVASASTDTNKTELVPNGICSRMVQRRLHKLVYAIWILSTALFCLALTLP